MDELIKKIIAALGFSLKKILYLDVLTKRIRF